GPAGLPVQVPKDFAPVAYLGGAAMFITAAPRLGAKTLPELIELARQRPGELAYGTNGPGRLTHLTGELLQSRAGIRLLMVPYSGGTAQVLNDVMGGRIRWCSRPTRASPAPSRRGPGGRPPARRCRGLPPSR